MVFLTVFRHVPRPTIGMVGVVYDRTFAALEANLDWLERRQGVLDRSMRARSSPFAY